MPFGLIPRPTQPPARGRTAGTAERYLENNAVFTLTDYYLASDGPYYDAALSRLVAQLPASGATIKIPDGAFPMNAPQVITGVSDLCIVGPGDLVFPNLTTSRTPLTITGVPQATTTRLTAGHVKGDRSLLVNSTAALGALAGDMCMMLSTEGWSECDGQYLKGEMLFVESVDSPSFLTVREGLRDDYAVNTGAGIIVTLTRIAAITNVVCDGFGIISSGVGAKTFGLIVAYADGVRIRGVRLAGCESLGIGLTAVNNWSIEGACRVLDTTNGGAVPATGYAYAIDNCTQHGAIDASCFAKKFRHAFTCGSVYPCRDFSIAGAKFAGNSTIDDVIKVGAVETHMNGDVGAFHGVAVSDSGRGIVISHRNGQASACVVTGIINDGFGVELDGCLGAMLQGNVSRGGAGVNVGEYKNPFTGIAGTKPTSVQIIDHDHEGIELNGVAVEAGVSVSCKNTTVRGGRFKNIRRMLVQADNCRFDGVELVDVRTNGQIGFYFTNNAAQGKVRRCVTRSEIASEMHYAVQIDAGCDRTEITDNDFRDYLVAPINDLGTRTVFKRNRLNGRLQSKSVFAAVGATNATLAGKVKTTNATATELNGAIAAVGANDNYWTIVGATTTVAQFRKVLLCVSQSVGALVVVGDPAPSQAAAVLPNWEPWDAVPVACVEIPNNYTDGNTLATFVFRDFVGVPPTGA